MATEEERLSLQLYDYLCEVIGSEKTVAARRLFYLVDDDRDNTIFSKVSGSPFSVVNSGSKAEGLNFKGSDLDIMLVLKIMVFNHSKCPLKSHLLCYDKDSSQPGFCKIKICPSHVYENQSNVFRKFEIFSSLFRNSTVLTENAIFVSCYEFKRFCLSENFGNAHMSTPNAFKLHGPCLSLYNDSVDLAICLHCPNWPSQASTWISRHRSSYWPSADIVSQIVSNGVVFVPTGISTEWRISFSAAEKLLIHSLNHTQFLCYALLKYVLKEVINDVPDLQDLLCSYFMKTVVFWILEETDAKDWTPRRLFLCFEQCFKRLVYFVQCGYCPNYFMPDNNMFKNKIYGKYQKELYSFLSEIYDGGILYVVMSCKSMHGFQNNMAFMINIDDTDKGIYPLLAALKNCCSDYPLNFLSCILMRVFRVKKSVPKLAIYLYLDAIAHITSYVACYLARYNHDMRNRKLYNAYRNWRYHLLIGAACDNVRGWLYLAMFFYCHRQYDKTLQIVEFVLAECTNDKKYLRKENHHKWKVNDNTKHLSFIERLRTTCVYGDTYIGSPTNGTFSLPLIKEISKDEMIDRISSKSVVLKYFISVLNRFLAAIGKKAVSYPFSSTPIVALLIRLLCHQHLNNRLESQCSFTCLTAGIKDLELSPRGGLIESAILERAAVITGSDLDTVPIHFEILTKGSKNIKNLDVRMQEFAKLWNFFFGDKS